MMKKKEAIYTKDLKLKPDGWPCSLGACRPGLFVYKMDEVCMKTSYKDSTGNIEVYLSDGSVFWGGTSNHESRSALIVQPVKYIWERHYIT